MQAKNIHRRIQRNQTYHTTHTHSPAVSAYLNLFSIVPLAVTRHGSETRAYLNLCSMYPWFASGLYIMQIVSPARATYEHITMFYYINCHLSYAAITLLSSNSVHVRHDGAQQTESNGSSSNRSGCHSVSFDMPSK